MKENNLKDLFNYALEQGTKVRRGIIYSILNKLFDLAPPVLIGVAIDIVVEGSDSFIGNLGYADRRQQLIILAIVTFIIWGLESSFDYIAAVTWRNISQDIEHSLRTDTFNNVLGLDLAFFENKSSGRLMAILNDDVNQLETFLDNGANRLVQTATTVVVIGGTFLYISPLVAVFAFIPIPVIIFGSLKFTSRIAERYSKIRNDIENLNANLSNSITGILTVKSFNRERKESERITTSSREVKSANYHAIKLSAAFIPIIRIAILFGFTATLLIGGFLALDGEIKVATYSVMLFITQRLLWPLTELGIIFDAYQKAMASFRRIVNLKNTKATIENGSNKLVNFNDKIQISNLNFEYVQNFPVLNDISIDIKKGETSAIVGSTGSGKTTVLSLIGSLYDINSGKISFNDDDISKLSISSVRDQITIVSQDIVIFDQSLEDNIRYADPLATREMIIEAAKKAEIEKLLLERKDTPVGPNGSQLSGGQKQRIALARAFLKPAPILLLDEATSALDAVTEASIAKSLNKLSENTTTIVVAHKLSNIEDADIIFVLDEGNLVEFGTHSELIKKENGYYRNLYEIQFKKSEAKLVQPLS
mgnify:CR=1 FL=1